MWPTQVCTTPNSASLPDPAGRQHAASFQDCTCGESAVSSTDGTNEKISSEKVSSHKQDSHFCPEGSCAYAGCLNYARETEDDFGNCAEACGTGRMVVIAGKTAVNVAWMQEQGP
jgi:hypothetical protein